MNNSVILQVDESTKGLMEEIQSGISSSIENGIREVKDKVESVDGTTEMILKKFKNFDGVSSTIEQLRTLAEESKKFTAFMSPLERNVSDIKDGNKIQEQVLSQVKSNVDILAEGVVQLNDMENNNASDLKNKIQNVLDNIEKGNGKATNLLNDIFQKISHAESERKNMSDMLNACLSSIKDSIGELSQNLDGKASQIEAIIHELRESHNDFDKRYLENETIHNTFESKTTSQIEDINKSIEKVQATLDIIVNLVTPFWKKW